MLIQQWWDRSHTWTFFFCSPGNVNIARSQKQTRFWKCHPWASREFSTRASYSPRFLQQGLLLQVTAPRMCHNLCFWQDKGSQRCNRGSGRARRRHLSALNITPWHVNLGSILADVISVTLLHPSRGVRHVQG